MRGASWALWMRSYSGLYGSFSSSPSQLPLCSTFAMGNLCKLLLLLSCVSPLFSFFTIRIQARSTYDTTRNTNTNTTFANCCLYSVTALYFCGRLGIWCVVLILLRRRGPWERPTYETTWILSIETLPDSVWSRLLSYIRIYKVKDIEGNILTQVDRCDWEVMNGSNFSW